MGANGDQVPRLFYADAELVEDGAVDLTPELDEIHVRVCVSMVGIAPAWHARIPGSSTPLAAPDGARRGARLPPYRHARWPPW